jgi:carboxymethylenebutenolidase
MCFAHDARPPELPADLRRIAGAAPGERLELTSADGTRFAAYVSVPPGAGRTAVVILPDVRGLYRFYEELAERFAAAGHPAVTFDYFGRTAGAGARDDDFDYWPHVEQTRVELVQQDAAAARDALLERVGGDAAGVPVATVGFCYGGFQSFVAAASSELGLDGAVGFYGALSGKRFGVAPKDVAGDMACPVLGLFGGADQGIPEDEVEAFDAALEAAGVPHEVHVYPGAPHSFFDRAYEQFAAESEDAWRRTLAFLEGLAAG